MTNPRQNNLKIKVIDGLGTFAIYLVAVGCTLMLAIMLDYMYGIINLGIQWQLRMVFVAGLVAVIGMYMIILSYNLDSKPCTEKCDSDDDVESELESTHEGGE